MLILRTFQYIFILRHGFSLHSTAYYAHLMPIIILSLPAYIIHSTCHLLCDFIPNSSLFLHLQHLLPPFLLLLFPIAFIYLLLQSFPYRQLLLFFFLQHDAFFISTLEYGATLLELKVGTVFKDFATLLYLGEVHSCLDCVVMHAGWDGGRVAAARVESRRGCVVYFLQFLREIFVRAHELVIFISILLNLLTLLVLPLLLLHCINSLMQRHFLLSHHRVPSSPLAPLTLPPSDLISLLNLPLQLLLIHPLLHFLIVLLVLRWGEVGAMLVCAYDAEGVADVQQFVAFVVVGASVLCVYCV